MLDPDSRTPLYQQLAEMLRERILSRELKAGDLLPSEPALVSQFDVSRTTARLALAELRREGLVETVKGAGTRVRGRRSIRRLGADRYSRAVREAGLTPSQADAGKDPSRTHVIAEFTVMRATPEIAKRLDLPSRQTGDVQERSFRFFVDGEPTQLSRSYVPYDLVVGTAVEDPRNEPWPGGTIGQMESVGVTVTEVTEELEARSPTAEEARLLRLPGGVPVTAVTRTMWAAGRPVETADIFRAADRIRLSYRIRVD
ncbi:MAG: GntR family transcriptional regulator [Egibacteraceae bacterium]